MRFWIAAFLSIISAAGSLGASMKGVDRSVRLMVRDLTDGIQTSSESVAVPHLFTLEGKNTVLGRLLSQKLISELAKSGKLMPVERDFIFKLTEEMKLNMTGLVEPKTAQQVGKIFGAEYVIVGTMEHFEDEIEVSARLVRTETSRIERTVDVSFDASPELISLFNQEIKLNRDVAAVAEAPQKKSAVSSSVPESKETLAQNSVKKKPEPAIKLDQEYFETHFKHSPLGDEKETEKEFEKKRQDDAYYKRRALELNDVERKNEEKTREIEKKEEERAKEVEKESKEWQEKMERAREKEIENLNRRNIIIFMPR